ncbi:AMP-binding protein (plasmid) [Massilia forsythiae]|uniref:AMP-binding protein n=1 Tax=Massilia forsythiae TaxID=2728020 RepID=A0A7Z2ZVM7_9BURK|nr:non-ribosomal peptide synthetase [Massilia forsythiae]QJE03669.1 AMP-binding protein [Massilia forsythiae]
MNFLNLRPRLKTFADRHIHYLDESQVARQISFPDFADKAEALIERLRAAGVQPGWRVGMVAPNCRDWLVWDLALMELGCTVVAFPDDMVQEQGVKLFESYDLSLIVLARDGVPSALRAHPNTAWIDMLGTGRIEWRTRSGRVPFPVDDVCALAFSSGVSGTPKCLMINRRGIEWDVEHFVPSFRTLEDDRLLLFLPLTHQQQRLLAYAAYWHGTSIALTPPEALFPALEKLKPTLCLAPPLLYESIHERFMAALDDMAPGKRRLVGALRTVAKALPGFVGTPVRKLLFQRIYATLGGRMRLMITGMAPIKRAALDFFEELGIDLYEAYGLTETGVIAANTPAGKRLGAVGKPVEGSIITLGEGGEVMVQRSQYASFGYLHPDGSTELFPVGAPMATGDIGKFDQDGYLYLLGRKKEIIITSQGHKIHPERIETLLNAHAEVGKAVVVGNQHKQLVALISLRRAATPQVEQALGAWLAAINSRLRDAEQIGKFVLTDVQFSVANGLLTRSLKLNRRAIEKRFSMELFGMSSVDEQPLSEEEIRSVDPDLLQLVKATWEAILERSNLPLKENFFALGGDSLCAMRIIAHLQEKTGTGISVRELFQDPTILGVARCLSNERDALPAEETLLLGAEEGAI